MDALLEGITQSLQRGEPISLRDLGTFKCVPRKARQGVNPRTGEKIRIKARQAVRFSAGTKRQQAVNQDRHPLLVFSLPQEAALPRAASCLPRPAQPRRWPKPTESA